MDVSLLVDFRYTIWELLQDHSTVWVSAAGVTHIVVRHLEERRLRLIDTDLSKPIYSSIIILLTRCHKPHR